MAGSLVMVVTFDILMRFLSPFFDISEKFLTDFMLLSRVTYGKVHGNSYVRADSPSSPQVNWNSEGIAGSHLR